METPQLAGNESWTHSNSLIFSSLIVSLFSSNGALRGNVSPSSIFSSSECRELRQASVLAFPVNSKRQTMEEKNGFLTTFVSIFQLILCFGDHFLALSGNGWCARSLSLAGPTHASVTRRPFQTEHSLEWKVLTYSRNIQIQKILLMTHKCFTLRIKDFLKIKM